MVYKSLINNWINVYIGVLEEGISDEKIIQRRIENIDKEATKKLLLWTEDGIFSDVPWDKTADLTECYTRLYDITRAYYVKGCKFYNCVDIREKILYSLRWLYENRYGQKEIDGVG